MRNYCSIPRRYWNSFLWIEINTEILEVDPETGNQVPKKSIIECRAFIKEDTLRSKQYPQPGQGLHEIAVIGRMCMPTKLPVKAPIDKISAKINDQEGLLDISVVIDSSCEIEIQQKVAGQKFKGYFRVQG